MNEDKIRRFSDIFDSGKDNKLILTEAEKFIADNFGNEAARIQRVLDRDFLKERLITDAAELRKADPPFHIETDDVIESAELRYYTGESQYGICTVFYEEDYLSAVYFTAVDEDDFRGEDGKKPPFSLRKDNSLKKEFKKIFARDFGGIKVLLLGDENHVKIWETIARIPAGRLVSYSVLAEAAGFSKGYSRAAGAITGANPVSFLIPCHRVVGVSGDLTGYAGGLGRKILMLADETL